MKASAPTPPPEEIVLPDYDGNEIVVRAVTILLVIGGVFALATVGTLDKGWRWEFAVLAAMLLVLSWHVSFKYCFLAFIHRGSYFRFSDDGIERFEKRKRQWILPWSDVRLEVKNLMVIPPKVDSGEMQMRDASGKDRGTFMFSAGYWRMGDGTRDVLLNFLLRRVPTVGREPRDRRLQDRRAKGVAIAWLVFGLLGVIWALTRWMLGQFDDEYALSFHTGPAFATYVFMVIFGSVRLDHCLTHRMKLAKLMKYLRYQKFLPRLTRVEMVPGVWYRHAEGEFPVPQIDFKWVVYSALVLPVGGNFILQWLVYTLPSDLLTNAFFSVLLLPIVFVVLQFINKGRDREALLAAHFCREGDDLLVKTKKRVFRAPAVPIYWAKNALEADIYLLGHSRVSVWAHRLVPVQGGGSTDEPR